MSESDIPKKLSTVSHLTLLSMSRRFWRLAIKGLSDHGHWLKISAIRAKGIYKPCAFTERQDTLRTAALAFRFYHSARDLKWSAAGSRFRSILSDFIPVHDSSRPSRAGALFPLAMIIIHCIGKKGTGKGLDTQFTPSFTILPISFSIRRSDRIVAQAAVVSIFPVIVADAPP